MPKSNPVERRVTVTPAMAREWLRRNVRNRNLRELVVRRYLADMIAGRWQYVGDPIRFDTAGNLIDGQHRLTALARCPEELAIDMLVITKLPAQTQMFMDQGSRRTPGDQLGLIGAVDANVVAAGIRLYLAIETGLLFRDNNTQALEITTTAVQEWYLANQELVDAARVPHVRSSDAPMSVAFCASLLFTKQHGPEFAAEFFRLLNAGAGEGHPINTLDKRLQRIRRERITQSQRDLLALFIQAANAWVEGRDIARFQKPRGSKWTAKNYPTLRSVS